MGSFGTDGPAAPSTSRRRFHTTFFWWVWACFWGFLGLLTGGAALNPDVPGIGRMVCAALAAGVVAVLVLGWRAGVEVDDDTVTVRTYRGTSTTTPWRDVVGFETVSNANGGVYIAVVDREGRRLTTQGLSAAGPRSATATRVMADLEGLRPGTPRGEA